MAMKIRTVRYIFKQGFVGLWRNRGMSLASIGSVAASLVVLGLIIILVLNINNAAETLQSDFDTVRVYLEEDLTEEETARVGQVINALDDVRMVEYESKEQALANYKESWGEEGYLLEFFQENPLSNSYIIHLWDIEVAHKVVAVLENVDGIDEVRYNEEIIQNLLRMATFIRTIGLVLIFVLILVAMFIISNTVKLALNARRQEINIMKYVGATNWFIRWPFVVEGVILGLIGAVLALLMVHYGYQYTLEAINLRFTAIFSGYLLPIDSMMQRTTYMFVVLGSGVGALGSIISLRKHLKV